MMHDDTTLIEPPKNINAECTVLGACLIDYLAIERAVNILNPVCFYPSAHKEIFNEILALHSEHKPVDLVSVSEYLDRYHKLDMVGGRAYLATLEQHVLTTQNVEHYASLVLDAYIKREAIQEAREIIKRAHTPELKSEDLLATALNSLNRLNERQSRGGPVHIREIALPEMLAIEQRSLGNNGEGALAVKTAIQGLDDKTGGLFEGEVCVIVARTNVGKTALAGTMINNIINQGRAVVLFSLEMNMRSMFHRFLALRMSAPAIPVSYLRAGIKSRDILRRVNDESEALMQRPLYIDHCPGLRPSKLSARLNVLRSRVSDLALVVVDYVQLMRGDGDYRGNRVTELEDVSLAIKTMAGEFNLPFVILSQANRANPTNPQLHNIKGSGAFEQDADLVLILRRPDMDANPPLLQERAVIDIAKSRSGPHGEVDVIFHAEQMKFTDAATEDAEEQAVSLPYTD